MLIDQRLCNGKAEAGAFTAARDERKEHVLAQLLRHAGTVVVDLDAHHQAVAGLTDGKAALDARAQHELAASVERLYGVAGHVERRLDEKLRIGVERRDAGIVIARDVHTRR